MIHRFLLETNEVRKVAHKMTVPSPYIVKPHLQGESFYWPGGPRGVLLVHGLSATTAEIRPLAQALHTASYTVAGPLLPGHNTHPKDLNHVRWQDWGAEVEAAYLRLQAECSQVAAGGESTGGVLSMHLALQHPEVAAVLLFAPALRLALSPVEVLALRLIAPFVPWVAPRAGGPELEWRGYSVRPVKAILQLIALQNQVIPHLERITQPLLVVQGRLDPTVHPGVPDLIERRVGSRLKEKHWLDHSAHCVVLDQEAGRVAEITLRFLDRVWQS